MGRENNNNKYTLKHVAIIMDGNGRWAKQRNLPVIEGHKAGSEAVKRTIEAAKEFGLQYLTLFAFSTENWQRPKEEVDALMNMLSDFIDKNINEIVKKNIRVLASGRLHLLPEVTNKKLMKLIRATTDNTGGTVVLAISYGGRAEIVDAVKEIAKQVKYNNLNPEDIDEQLISQNLYLPDIPDPDLIIRTSGEFRISNFLLWESAYSEFFISNMFWPDFDKNEFEKAIESFYLRKRRFGKRI